MENKLKLLAILLLSWSLVQTGFSKSVSDPESKADQDYYQDDNFEYDDDYDTKLNGNEPIAPSIEDNTITNPPYFDKNEITVSAKPGENLTLNCDVRNFGISNVVVWYKDQTIITNGLHSLNNHVEAMKNNSVVLINIDGYDAGNYYCEVLPQKIRMKTTVVVSGKLIIEFDGRDMTDRTKTLSEGGNHVLDCKTFLPTNAKITWSLNGNRAENTVTRVEGSKLFIEGLSDQHAGIYQCLADDFSVDPPHGSLLIDVQYTPKISTHRHFVNTENGDSAELSCEYKGNPIAMTHWFKGNKQLDHFSEKYSIRSIQLSVRNETILTIKKVNPHDLGEYECSAENQLGSSSAKVHLIFAPEHPQYESMDMKGNVVTLVWLVRSLQPLSEAVLDYKLDGSFAWSTVTVIRTERHLNKGFWKISHVMELSPGKWFARVKVKNTVGWSKFSAPHTFNIEASSYDDDDFDPNGEGEEISMRDPADNLVKAGIGSRNGSAANAQHQITKNLFSAILLCLILQHLVPRF